MRTQQEQHNAVCRRCHVKVVAWQDLLLYKQGVLNRKVALTVWLTVSGQICRSGADIMVNTDDKL